jgi:hypothetical protein
MLMKLHSDEVTHTYIKSAAQRTYVANESVPVAIATLRPEICADAILLTVENNIYSKYGNMRLERLPAKESTLSRKEATK